MLRRVVSCIFFTILAAGYGQVGKVLFSESRLVPRLLNYQGYLTDTLGSPIDDSLDMTFRIFDDATVGNELWTETQTDVPVERGVFSALLGSSTPIPDTVFTKGTDRWLEMTLEGTQTLSPRTRITAMGYAYTSTYSDTAEYAKNAAADNDWARGTPDSVLFTANYLGIARGGAGNMLYGDNAHSHTNLGVACTTGTSGMNYYYCTVSGGYDNTASGPSATVGGGDNNAASDTFTTVGGGSDNTANAWAATVGGGWNHTASGPSATVGGGSENTASDYYATVVGGHFNIASGGYSTVSGGLGNTASGLYATVCGGDSNHAGGDRSFAAGHRAKADYGGSFVWADGTGGDFASTGVNQFLVRASGGVGIGTTSPDEQLHVVGNIKMVDGNQAAGKVLTSDANGVGSWQASGGIPSGVIVMWSGSIANIPEGWVLCDGTMGTPDLRDRFIVGAGNSYSVGATGGEVAHTLTVDEMPSHRHSLSCNYSPPGGTGPRIVNSGQPESSIQYTNYTGGNQSHENRPPYYALAYIMKL